MDLFIKLVESHMTPEGFELSQKPGLQAEALEHLQKI